MSKLCIKCGAELEDEAAFCDDCGAQQTTLNTPQPQHTNPSNINTDMGIPGDMTTGNNTKKQSGFGIASLVLGIISLLSLGILIIPEILGITFGFVGLVDKSKNITLAVAGLILSILSTLLFIILLFI